MHGYEIRRKLQDEFRVCTRISNNSLNPTAAVSKGPFYALKVKPSIMGAIGGSKNLKI